jgi:hypothetical protein
LVTLTTQDCTISVDASGFVTGIVDARDARDYAPKGSRCPLLALVTGGQPATPTACEYDAGADVLTLHYLDGKVTTTVRVARRPTHVTFRLEKVEGASVSEVGWGPLLTTVSETIGGTVGVVRDGHVAIGIQSLGVETVGGASPAEGGSSLWAKATEHDGGVLGSGVALFLCPADQALARIGEIEVAEGLPHPMLDGVWAKVSPRATCASLIAPFGESDIDELVRRTRQAGLTYLYHPGPFRTWGHFQLDPGAFPEGDVSMRRCVERAEAAGVRLGVHTLTAFITTNDAYVTPVPDPRLARWGSSLLSMAVDGAQTAIRVSDPAPFRDKGTLGACIIQHEIVQYDSVSAAEPWTLEGCRRGAFGTQASAHGAGTSVGHLADHAYRTLYPGIENGMMDELTNRLVELFNSTGLRQISFDGLEGLSAYGYGEYSRNRFVKQCFDGWKPEVINDASNLLHYLWHIHTRMNWGEPWGAALREGMPDYRFKNQAYFEANLFPKMLGWFQLRLAGGDVPATSLEEVEWLLSKAAGFESGFALVSSTGEMNANGRTDAMLAAVREWETARAARAFSAEQRARLRAGDSDWHLEPREGGGWWLTPVSLVRFRFPEGQVQPGQPLESEWALNNPFGAQPCRFTIRVLGKAGTTEALREPEITVGGRQVTLRAEVKPGGYLIYGGAGKASVYDPNWNRTAEEAPDVELPAVGTGAQTVLFRCPAVGTGMPSVEVTFRLEGEREPVGGGKG